MFLSSSYPEINKSPQPAKNREGESSSRPESSLLEDGESDFAGDEESGPNEDDDLILFDDPHTATNYINQRLPCLASSLPNLPRTFQDSRKKKRKKKRPGSENGSPRINRKAVKASSLASINALADASTSKNIKGNVTKFGFIPLRAHTDLQHSIGRRRGIAGNPNEPKMMSYLPVTIFMLFYFTDIFDEWILNEGYAKGFPTRQGKAVRAVLQKEILYSLRSSYFCPNDKIAKLYSILCPGPESPLSFTDIGRFLHNFLEKVLNLTESTHYTSGMSECIHDLKRTKETEKLSNLQDLFQYSMKFSKKDELKLLSIPKPALILTFQNIKKNPNDKILPHKPIIPNVFLDISDVLIQLLDDTDETLRDSEFNLTRSTNSRINDQQKSESHFCRCIRNALRAVYDCLQNLVFTFPGMFTSSDVSLDDSWSTSGGDSSLRSNNSYKSGSSPPKPVILDEEAVQPVSTNESRRYNSKTKAPVLLDLMSVVCLSKDGKYTVFVRCSQNPKRGWAPWILFDPLDQGSPCVRRIEDFGKWIDRLERKPEKVKTKWNAVPKDIQKVLTESVLFIYHTKPISETQNNTFLSFVSEK